jgi:hypothetical protein
MKIIGNLLLVSLLVSSNGCMTYNTVQHAKGNQAGHIIAVEPVEDKPGDGKSHPAYYALLALSIPADIVTAPIQGVVFLWNVGSGKYNF